MFFSFLFFCHNFFPIFLFLFVFPPSLLPLTKSILLSSPILHLLHRLPHSLPQSVFFYLLFSFPFTSFLLSLYTSIFLPLSLPLHSLIPLIIITHSSTTSNYSHSSLPLLIISWDLYFHNQGISLRDAQI